MPGEVSSSYDPEFSTGENAARVHDAVQEAGQRITDVIGSGELKYIVDVVDGQPGASFTFTLTERELRIIRFAINRALESL
jgi:hypothetical protein